MQNKIKNTRIIIDNYSIKSLKYNDFYFNSIDPVAESRFVYLKTNCLKEKFKKSKFFIIGELGFGTGLNFLLTRELWLKYKKRNFSLHYISFEKHPLSKNILKKIYKNLNKLDQDSQLIINSLPINTSGIHDLYFNKDNIHLTLIYKDFSYIKNLNFMADVWFLDGFSPLKNKSAWKKSLFKYIYKNTKVGGSFSTFTSASKVQKKIKYAGFDIFKKDGFKYKREMIFGYKPNNHGNLFKNTFKNLIEPVAIIGAGITGCSIAYSLRKRNINCFVVDKENTIGQGASGNLAALQLPKLTLKNSIQGIFSLRSFLYSRNLAINLLSAPDTNGVIVYPSREREIEKFKKLLCLNWEKYLFSKYVGKFSKCNQISHLYSNSGIVDNFTFLKKLLGKTDIFNNFEVQKVIKDGDNRILIGLDGKMLSTKSIVWANGYKMKDQLQNNLIIPVSGQVTYLKENEHTKKIKYSFSYGKSFLQSLRGFHQVGSSFDRNSFIKTIQNDQKNLHSIPEQLKKNINFNNDLKIFSRLSIRASTRNRLPFFGCLNDIQQYFIGGMGAWGYIYAPFMAELLVRKILNEPILLEKKILKILDLENNI